ncbi:MAG TPA: ATP-binding protein [Sphingomicrobium sp.]|nr:ATP-binding protein [Sphingomicrobium sp.]
MSVSVLIGSAPGGGEVRVDIEELLATRLLVQGNSGSGKSHLLRRLLEESAGLVQQVVIDPEGDFVTLAEPFGHVVIDGSAYGGPEIGRLAARIRKHRASVVLALDGLEIESQMRCAAQFLGALFDAPRDQWYPALVVVDEAQVFAPAAAGEVSDEARRLSLAAMTNLMCRGRKRGLAGVIATQRLAKLAKNVAAEASNFLMGRTFLDIDMARAADLLGMERRQAEQIRDLERGHFLALGPAISRRPLSVRIGPVQTSARSGSHGLVPLPSTSSEELHQLLHSEWLKEEMAERPPEPEPVRAEVLLHQIETSGAEEGGDNAPDPVAIPASNEAERVLAEILEDMASEEGSTFQPTAALYQDFSVRCRMRRIAGNCLDLPAFRRRFAMASAGIADPSDPRWADLLGISRTIPDDLLGPFLLLARAAQQNDPCPDDEAIARVYGTGSLGRVRRLMDHLEKSGLVVIRSDFAGRRSVGIPALGVTTAPLEA